MSPNSLIPGIVERPPPPLPEECEKQVVPLELSLTEYVGAPQAEWVGVCIAGLRNCPGRVPEEREALAPSRNDDNDCRLLSTWCVPHSVISL